MIRTRKLWLCPTLLFVAILYYFLQQSWRDRHHPHSAHLATIHLDPKNYQRRYPVTSHIALPTSTAITIPKIQYDFSARPEDSKATHIRLERRDAIKSSFLHAWKGYRQHAWTKDEVSPLSGDWSDSFGGWGATLVDTMDTLWMMGLKDDFEECVKEVEKIDWTTNTEEDLNVFETTIRYLGGLLSAYDLSEGQYPSLLAKAQELGEILYMAFDTKNHMPLARWKWTLTAQGNHHNFASSSTLLAELGSLTLELTRLSQLTKDPKYYDAVQRVTEVMAENQERTRVPGLWPTIVDAQLLNFDYNHFTFGGMADSTYEYLPKQYLLLGGTDEMFKDMYVRAIEVAKKYLLFRPMTPQNADILFSGNTGVNKVGGVTTQPQGQHLSCFVGGMMGIASKVFSRPDDLDIARKLVDGCIWAYNSMPSGLMPELFNVVPCHTGTTLSSPGSRFSLANDDCTWSDDAYFGAVAEQQNPVSATTGLSKIEAGKWWVRQKSLIAPYTEIQDARYILRPEAIESIFILYRITGDASLLDSAWTMFQAIEAATRTNIAHAAVSDVRVKSPPKTDKMESFWLAETLKYFYLIFEEPDVVSLDDFVFNTEAHPFRRPRAGERVD